MCEYFQQFYNFLINFKHLLSSGGGRVLGTEKNNHFLGCRNQLIKFLRINSFENIFLSGLVVCDPGIDMLSDENLSTF